MVKLQRKEKPTTCEMFVIDKNTKMLKRCTNRIRLIWNRSGGFLCIDCAKLLYKRFPGYGKYYIASTYLKRWFP